MIPLQSTDPRPQERFIWIDKFRKIKPVSPPPPDSPAGRSQNPEDERRSVITAGLEEYTGPWESTQVAHLIRRALFGVRKSDAVYFQSLSMNESVDALLTTSPAPDPPVNDYQNVDDDAIDPAVALGESWLTAPHGDEKEGYRIISLKSWIIKNIVLQERTVHQKMNFFWSNLLVTKVWDVYIAKMSYHFFEMLHAHSLGNYKELIKALTLDPSMLLFLNGESNNKQNPNENYARELQELFCVGKGVDSHYTEADVRAAARVLTGWVLNWEAYSNPGTFVSSFSPSLHDPSDKQFSSFYGNTVINGKTGAAGADELDELLSMVITNEESSRYICRRLYSFFVYTDIDANTEQNVILPLAEIFRTNNYEILPVLRTLFKSAHFYDARNMGALIKSPAEHLFGLWRCLGVDSPPTSDLLKNYQIHSAMLWHMAEMGLEIGDPPNVAGWPAYYQAPQYDQSWITTDTITKRAITSDSLIFWGYWINSDLQIKANLPDFVATLDNPADPTSLLVESSRLLVGMEISAAMIESLKSILLSGQTADGYWTGAWNAYKNDPEDENNKQIVATRLQATFQRLLQLAEFHLK